MKSYKVFENQCLGFQIAHDKVVEWLLRLLKTNVRVFELWKIRWWLLRRLAEADVRFLLQGTEPLDRVLLR